MRDSDAMHPQHPRHIPEYQGVCLGALIASRLGETVFCGVLLACCIDLTIVSLTIRMRRLFPRQLPRIDAR